jgi:hypothetical protein
MLDSPRGAVIRVHPQNLIAVSQSIKPQGNALENAPLLMAGRQASKSFWRRMTHWTASVVAILLASVPGLASAQVDCDGVPRGSARTDCYLGLSQFYRGQSDLAAARARVQSDAAWYRAITGIDPPKDVNPIIESGDWAGSLQTGRALAPLRPSNAKAAAESPERRRDISVDTAGDFTARGRAPNPPALCHSPGHARLASRSTRFTS